MPKVRANSNKSRWQRTKTLANKQTNKQTGSKPETFCLTRSSTTHLSVDLHQGKQARQTSTPPTEHGAMESNDRSTSLIQLLPAKPITASAETAPCTSYQTTHTDNKATKQTQRDETT
jgi:hypothetical protein